MGFKQSIRNFFFGDFHPEQSTFIAGEYSNMTPVRTTQFNGEKTPQELGEILNVLPDFQSLRLRAHEADLKSDVVKIITNRFFKWIIGTGLKLQSEPIIEILRAEKITDSKDLSDFRQSVESRFNLWARSKKVDYKCRLHFIH